LWLSSAAATATVVFWALLVDRLAFLPVTGAGALQVGRVVHAQEGLLHQALAVGARIQRLRLGVSASPGVMG
jgi:hypothetical protein